MYLTLNILCEVFKYGVFSGPYFLAFGLKVDTPYLSVFSPNTGKYGPERTPYLDIFMPCIPRKHHEKSLIDQN